MKRIVSLDFLRGFAIFIMLASHVMLHVYTYANDFDAVLDDPVLLAIFVPIFLLSHFRSFFLMISMTIHAYIVVRGLKAGKSTGAVLKKQVFGGGLLYLVGLFTEGLAAYHGVFGNSLRAGTWRWDKINHVLHFETLQSIALSIIFVSVVVALLARDEGWKKERRNVLVLMALGLLFVVLAPLVHDAVVTASGGGYYTEKDQYTFSTAGEFFLKLGWAALAGLEQPVFPFMATTCIGGILGLLMARDEPPARLPKYGMLAGVGLVGAGVVVLAATGFDIQFEFYVHPTWFFLFLNGIQLILLLAVLKHYEFNPTADLDRFARRTTFFRRWSMVSLTIFVWQFFPERLVEVLAYLITGINYVDRGQTGHLETIIMMLLVLALWDAIIRLWEKAKFKGTFEWTMATLAARVVGTKVKSEAGTIDRMSVEGVLYHPEPVRFLPSRTSTQEKRNETKKE